MDENDDWETLFAAVDENDDWETFSVSQSFKTSVFVSQSIETSIQGPFLRSQSFISSMTALSVLPIVENVHGRGRLLRIRADPDTANGLLATPAGQHASPFAKPQVKNQTHVWLFHWGIIQPLAWVLPRTAVDPSSQP